MTSHCLFLPKPCLVFVFSSRSLESLTPRAQQARARVTLPTTDRTPLPTHKSCCQALPASSEAMFGRPRGQHLSVFTVCPSRESAPLLTCLPLKQTIWLLGSTIHAVPLNFAVGLLKHIGIVVLLSCSGGNMTTRWHHYLMGCYSTFALLVKVLVKGKFHNKQYFVNGTETK